MRKILTHQFNCVHGYWQVDRELILEGEWDTYRWHSPDTQRFQTGRPVDPSFAWSDTRASRLLHAGAIVRIKERPLWMINGIWNKYRAYRAIIYHGYGSFWATRIILEHNVEVTHLRLPVRMFHIRNYSTTLFGFR